MEEHALKEMTSENYSFMDINSTSIYDVPSERPYWMNVLDNVSTIIITVNVVTLMLGMGATTYIREVWDNMKRPWGCIIGIVCQFLILPASGYGLSLVLKLTSVQALSVLILTCSPGGAFSNFFTYWVDGDVALSILMTSVSSLLAFGGMPFNLWLYSSRWTDESDHLVIPYLNVLISMAFVMIPALIGMLIRYKTRLWANRIATFCSILGWIGALASAAFLILIYWDTIETATKELCLVAALVPGLGFSIAFFLAKVFCQNNKVSRTVGIETGCQNMVVAVNVMLLSYPDPQVRGEMILFPLLYGILQMGEIIVLIILFQLYKFIHRNDVQEEEITSVIDNTILTHVPMMPEKRKAKKVDIIVPDIIGEDNYELHDKKTFFRSIEQQKNKDESLQFLQNTNDSFEYESPKVMLPNAKKVIFSDNDSDNEIINVHIPFNSNSRQQSKKLRLERFNSSEERHIIDDSWNKDHTPRSPSLNSGYEFRTFGENTKR